MKGMRVLSKQEISDMLDASEPRERVLFLTGLYFGTRINESLKLTFGSVAGKFLYLKSSKGSENQAYPIPAEYSAAVESLRAAYVASGKTVNDSTPLFLSRQGVKAMTRQQASNVIVTLAEKLGIEGKVNTHSLRKCFVTAIYEMTGHDIIKTQTYSRHKNLSNLQYYIATTADTSLVSALAW